jgi:hypothetical protein
MAHSKYTESSTIHLCIGYTSPSPLIPGEIEEIEIETFMTFHIRYCRNHQLGRLLTSAAWLRRHVMMIYPPLTILESVITADLNGKEGASIISALNRMT